MAHPFDYVDDINPLTALEATFAISIGARGQSKDGDIRWAQFFAPNGAEPWIAIEPTRKRFATLGYHETLEVLYAYEYRLHRPTVIWRFDYKQRRPPQVYYVGRKGISEIDGRKGLRKPFIPDTIEVLFEALEIEIV
ncbi:hypothetical protein ACFQE8_23290 [Salinirubellus sp. GCM10025818]|uniref:hypothetical protein n=1 Tax=Salinirubellus TaxID=2162630 RepID=UPI0030CAD120